mmetsp:Transcript_22063/g.45952  ORF Transcript_22063/g.45952 Transcript_22063/m.45952 type:complete len:504 (-) Transcript_22063:41-1552(-)|eukprot:CAMPEP_0118652670 /NCGR_PEP_ID=MMETSP0785-20121206/11436_1 /TAXON_ID=91992 /ORGANISM="Bolidomonas pacifica, Strain CCMP 1866" /LENGTH=503 /DNA_ID=CAMNT_0006545191 /DNA_START=349 /DNA_END=1860 /DNA_ORIENTATION=+
MSPLGHGSGKPPSLARTIAGLAGNILEWYDFAVFGYFSKILGDVFFPPNQEGNAALLETFAVFGSAFLARPIGGILMGYIGDTYGRKRALELSIFLMAGPTFLMGCLPPYSLIGNWAILLLCVTRLMQGMSVGGQLMASAVFTIESQPDKSKHGLYGSFVFATANFGTLLGGVIGEVMMDSLSDDQLRSWGWRVPFLSGILVAGFGFYLKYYEEEDIIEGGDGGDDNDEEEDYDDEGDDDKGGEERSGERPKKANPLKEALTTNLRPTLCVGMVGALWSAGFYVFFVWGATYMNDLLSPPIPHAFAVNAAALFVGVCIFFSIGGSLSDTMGRRPLMLLGSLLSAILAPIALWLMASYKNPYLAFLAQTVFGIALSMFGGPMTAWMVESFPPSARLTSMSIGYNLSQCIFGGTSPAISTSLVEVGPVAPAIFISVCAVFAFIGVYISDVSDVDRAKIERFYGRKDGRSALGSVDVSLLKEGEGESDGKGEIGSTDSEEVEQNFV